MGYYYSLHPGCKKLMNSNSAWKKCMVLLPKFQHLDSDGYEKL